MRTLPPEALQVTPTGQVRVDLGGRSLVDVIREDLHAQVATTTADLRSLYRAAPGGPAAAAPSGAAAAAERAGSSTYGGATIDRWVVRQPGGLAMPLVHVHGRGATADRIVLLLSLPGKVGPSDWPAIRRHLSRGSAVVGFDLRGTGEDRLRYRAVSVDDPVIAPADEAAAYVDPLSGVLANHVYNGLLTGRPYLFEAVDDVAAAAVFCRETLGAKRLAVAGVGDATLLAAVAARVLSLEDANDPAAPVFSWRATVEEGRERWPIQYLFPAGATLDDGRGRLR